MLLPELQEETVDRRSPTWLINRYFDLFQRTQPEQRRTWSMIKYLFFEQISAMRTYAVVAANMSIAPALVKVPHKKVKATVKVATRPRRAGILVT